LFDLRFGFRLGLLFCFLGLLHHFRLSQKVTPYRSNEASSGDRIYALSLLVHSLYWPRTYRLFLDCSEEIIGFEYLHDFNNLDGVTVLLEVV